MTFITNFFINFSQFREKIRVLSDGFSRLFSSTDSKLPEDDIIGAAVPWQMGMMYPATPVAEGISVFHTALMVILILIGVFVALLLTRCILVYSSNTKKKIYQFYTFSSIRSCLDTISSLSFTFSCYTFFYIIVRYG